MGGYEDATSLLRVAPSVRAAGVTVEAAKLSRERGDSEIDSLEYKASVRVRRQSLPWPEIELLVRFYDVDGLPFDEYIDLGLLEPTDDPHVRVGVESEYMPEGCQVASAALLARGSDVDADAFQKVAYPDATTKLTIDSRIGKFVRVEAARLTREPSDSGLRYKLALRLTSDEDWGRIPLMYRLLDAEGLVLDSFRLEDDYFLKRGLDTRERTANIVTVVDSEVVRAEVLWDGDINDGWTPVKAIDATGGALKFSGVLCEKRQHFEASNQVIVRLTGEVIDMSPEVFPDGALLEMTVYGERQIVLASGRLHIAPEGTQRIPFELTVSCYRHHPPKTVRVVIVAPGE